jgi:hypothetical protein
MTDITIKYNPIQTLGYVSCNVPADVLTAVRQEVQELIDSEFKYATPYNNKLAGSIENEFTLYKCTDLLNKFFRYVIPEYWKLLGNEERSKTLYQISNSQKQPDVWVNLQKKYEANPLHNHGGELSFVVYLKIPYDISNEKEQPHVKNSNKNLGPVFSFLLPTHPPLDNTLSLIKEHSISIDKNWEGIMIIFPSWLQHLVTPFYTSDDYRISVAGNLLPVNNG